MPEANTLIAVVVTCNRLDQLQITLARLLDGTALSQVVVVDNASDDGTSDWLADQNDARLVVLRNAQNLGGAGGFERGMRHAVSEFDPDWLVVMDDDARPEPGALSAFLAEDRTQAEAWVSAVHYPDGRVCEMNRPLLNPFWHPLTLLRSLWVGREGFHLSPDDTQRRAVDVGSFVGLFLSRKAISLAGFPDGGLFLYGDDTLYSLNLRRAGGSIQFDPALKFTHDCSTFQGEAKAISPLWKVYYMRRNQLMVYRRSAGWLLFWPTAALFAMKWRFQVRYYQDKPAYRRVLKRAIRDGIRQNTDMTLADVQNLAV